MKAMLIASPSETRNRSGVVTPTLNGAVRTSSTTWGNAWTVEEATTNYHTNPRFNGVGTLSGTYWDREALGDGRLKYTKRASASGDSTIYLTDSYSVSIAAATPFTSSLWIEASSSASGTYRLWGGVRSAAHPTNSIDVYSPYYVASASPIQRSASGTTIAAGVSTFLNVQISGTWATGDYIILSRPQAESKSVPTTYADGTMGTGYAWSGTANASTSTRTNAYVSIPNTADQANSAKGSVAIRYWVDPSMKTPAQSNLFSIGNYNDSYISVTRDLTSQYMLIHMPSGVTYRFGGMAVPNGWRTAVFTYDSEQCSLFLDDGSELIDLGITAPFNFVGKPFYIGNNGASANTKIASVATFEDVLTKAEMQRLMTMNGAWTWDNISDRPSVVVLPHTIASVQRIPTLYKATKHGQLLEDISDYITKGQVEYNPDREVRFTFRGTLNDPNVITPYADYLAPFLTVRYADGYEETSQLGLYAVMPFGQTITQQSRKIDIEGRDLVWLLSLDVFDEGYSVAEGTNIVTAVETILLAAGFTRFTIAPSNRVTTSTRSWMAGTTKLRVINDLLTGSGYYALGTAKDGRFISRTYQSIANPTSVVTYSTSAPTSRVRVVKDVKLETTQDRIANKIVVIKDNPSEDPIVVTKINSNPRSPTSTVSLDMTIAKVHKSSEIADADAAEVIATRLLEEASEQYTKATLYTTTDVLREPNEVYTLDIVDANGVQALSGNWHCRGWLIGFTPEDGPMQHMLSSVEEPPIDMAS